jgi:DNA-binding NtrC family response regulator
LQSGCILIISEIGWVFFWHYFPGLLAHYSTHPMELMQQPVIFVVEDNIIYQGLIAKELETLSSNIHFYTNGESCISELDKHPAVIVLDYNLDGQMNGLDTLQRVRDYDPNVYVILFSSQKGLNTKEVFLQYGAFDFLEKNSLSLRTLRQMVGCVTSPGDTSLNN